MAVSSDVSTHTVHNSECMCVLNKVFCIGVFIDIPTLPLLLKEFLQRIPAEFIAEKYLHIRHSEQELY